jgi:HPt (histidine-containing phosphotransfer) domain-containing protein
MRDQDSRDQRKTMYQDLPPTAGIGERQADAIAPSDAASRAAELEPALTLDAFDELAREIGQDGACEVRAVFWTDTSARLALFDGLVPAQHYARIEREAHSLKSAARTFGYCRLASLALRLEKSAAAMSDDDYRHLLAAMDAAYAVALAQEPQR